MNVSGGATRSKEQAAHEIRRRMWGDDHADRIALLRRCEPELADLVLREGFGGLYDDDRLTLEQRSLCTISSLVTQGKTRQLASHIEGALRIGIPPATLSAVMAQLFLYAGLPAVIEGLHVLEAVTGVAQDGGAGADR